MKQERREMSINEGSLKQENLKGLEREAEVGRGRGKVAGPSIGTRAKRQGVSGRISG